MSGNIHMSDIRLPLSEFEGVDLSDVESVTVAFDQTDSGSLFLADVQFVRPMSAIGANSTLLANADGANNSLKAVGRLRGSSTCTATYFDTGGSADSPAYVITNGHCVQPWDANEVFQDLPADGMAMTFNFFADTVGQTETVPAREITYSTMKGRDVAILELDATMGELASKGINPLAITAEPPSLPFSMRVVGAPVTGVPAELAYLREEACLATAEVNLFESVWHFDDAMRNSCQDIFGGSSGSPVFAGDDRLIVALINTSTVGGSSPCAAGAPCEVDEDGTEFLADTSYTTPIMGVAACFAGGLFDIAAADCPLDDGRQLRLNGYPSQPIQPSTVGTDGQEVDASWNTILTGDLPYYRYKSGPAGLTDCHSESDYSEVIALASRQRINDRLPVQEGSYVLCVVAGQTSTVDSSWQPLAWASVARAEIDITPPKREPFINIVYLRDIISIEPIFDSPELVDFRIKVGDAAITDCQIDEGYTRYRRIPIQIDKDELPQKVCVIGSDSAGNEGEPVEHVIAP